MKNKMNLVSFFAHPKGFFWKVREYQVDQNGNKSVKNLKKIKGREADRG